VRPIQLVPVLVLAALPAQARDVSVAMDEVRMVTFDKPVKTVYVGNPVIADITVIDSKRIFVLGKNFGTTNLVALNNDGEQVANDQVTVGRAGNTVTVQKGMTQITLACGSGRCEAAPAPGDETASVETVLGQIDKRSEQMLRAGAGAGQ
jgi:hypothetical protein